MKNAVDMSVEEFAAHLKQQREKLFNANDRHDVNSRWRKPKVAKRGTRISMQRRRTK